MSEMHTPSVPVGRYPAVAVRVMGEDGEPIIRFALAGEKQTKQCLVYFRILAGEYAGQVLPWFGFFTEKTWKRTVESLKYAGFKGDDLFSAEDQELDQKVEIEVEHNENPKTGDVYARVGWVNRIGAGAIKLANPMSRDVLRQFSAQMKSRLGAVSDSAGEAVDRSAPVTPANGNPAETAPPAAFGEDPPPAGEMDDIPF
jgi:hypothetical protein